MTKIIEKKNGDRLKGDEKLPAFLFNRVHRACPSKARLFLLGVLSIVTLEYSDSLI
jgi:hypothetical protein